MNMKSFFERLAGRRAARQRCATCEHYVGVVGRCYGMCTVGGAEQLERRGRWPVRPARWPACRRFELSELGCWLSLAESRVRLLPLVLAEIEEAKRKQPHRARLRAEADEDAADYESELSKVWGTDSLCAVFGGGPDEPDLPGDETPVERDLTDGELPNPWFLEQSTP